MGNRCVPDENIAVAFVGLDGLLHALGIVSVARSVHLEAKIRRKRLDSI